MKTLLIGDVGATTGRWAEISGDLMRTFGTTGYNPSQHDSSVADAMLEEVTEHLTQSVDAVFYYGAGIVSEKISERTTRQLRAIFGNAEISCTNDMIGAARAISPGKPGIVCILGTGSNSCLFNGREIVRSIQTLGFPLGDEGSGADIGRELVRAYYYGLMPSEIHAELSQMLPADRIEFLERYQKLPAKNRFLAGLIPHVVIYHEHPWMENMLQDRFRTFVRFHVVPYDAQLPVHAVGGIAFAFQDILKKTIVEEHCIAGEVLKAPLEGLIAFHKNRQR